MRLSVGTLRQVVKRDLPIAFVRHQLTSYGGLELLRRYVRRIGLSRQLQAACAALGGDYSGARLALLLLALPARRLEHLQYLVGDPLVRRFAGLARVPTARTVSNWLRRFTQETLRPLARLNQELVLDTLARQRPAAHARCRWHHRAHRRHCRLGLSRLQSSPSKGPQLLSVARPHRADGPHPASQEPPGQRARLQAIRRVPARADRRDPGPPGAALPLEFRMDAAFFQPDVLRLLAARGCAYAIKVGYWSWLPLKSWSPSAGTGTRWPRA